MQLSFRHKEQLFHELGQLAQSGLPFPTALEVAGRNARSRLGHAANRLQRGWESAHSAAGAFEWAGFASRDVSLVAAGEASGRMEEVFGELAAYYAKLAAAKYALISKSLYPLVVLHFGIILMPIAPAIVNGGWSTYLKSTLSALFVLYLVAGILLMVGAWFIRQLAVSRFLSRTFLGVPVLGRFFENWSGWSFSLVLALQIRAGGSLLGSFKAAADACGNAALTASAYDAIAKVQQGESLAEAFSNHEKTVPELILRALAVGEQSGRLDEEASHAARTLNQRVLRQLDLIGEWVPRILYFMVVIYTAWQIIGMVGNVGSSVDKMIEPE